MADAPIDERDRPSQEDGRVPARLGCLPRSLRLMQLATRAAAQTGLITLNTYQVAHGHQLGIFTVGCLISWLWWANAGHAGRSTDRFDGLVYGLGAGLGSLLGYVVAAFVLYG